MKLVLFLAAIYSLIIHQSRKMETVSPREQKTMTQKIITGNSPSSVKFYQEPIALRNDSTEGSGSVSSNKAGTHAKWREKDYPIDIFLARSFFMRR